MKDELKRTPLRWRVERVLLKKRDAAEKIPSRNDKRLLHDLYVHQVELEMQNEELRKAQAEIEKSGSRYATPYNFAPIGYFIFDRKGTIVDLNLTAARLLGLPRNQIIGTPLALFLTREFLQPFNRHLREVLSSNTSEACELRMTLRVSWSFA